MQNQLSDKIKYGYNSLFSFSVVFFDLKYILLYGYFTPVLKTHAVINGILSKIAIRILELFSIGAMLFSHNSNVIGVLSPFFSMSSYKLLKLPIDLRKHTN